MRDSENEKSETSVMHNCEECDSHGDLYANYEFQGITF